MAKQRAFTVVVKRYPETANLIGEVLELPHCFAEAPDIARFEKKISEGYQASFRNISSG